MHYLYYVKVPKKDAKTSVEARKKASVILDSNSFCNPEGGYFSGGKADWYVIGGRWSGHLQVIQMAKDFFTEIDKVIESNKYGLHTDQIKEHSQKLQEIWEELGGTGKNPYSRSGYDQDGQEDDAMIITKELIAILKDKDGGENSFGESVMYFDGEEEKSVDELTDEAIGDWLVVIDYHN